MDVSEFAECPACGDMSEPEQDGDLMYYACGCGHEFGYKRTGQSDSSCQLGIDETTRRRGSVPDTGLPVLQIGRRPE